MLYDIITESHIQQLSWHRPVPEVESPPIEAELRILLGKAPWFAGPVDITITKLLEFLVKGVR